MKKNFKTIFASMLAVLSCVSCSQNDDIVSDQDLTPKSLVISLPKTATTRNVEDQLLVDADPKYTNITVILYDGGNNAVTHDWADLSQKVMTIADVVKPAGVQVIVNTPVSQLATLQAAKTKAAVDAVLAAIAIAEQNLDPITSPTPYTSAQQTTYSGLAATIEEVAAVGDVAAYNKAAVALSSVTSRFEIGTIVAKENSGVKDLVIKEVYFNNYLGLNAASSAVVNLDGTTLVAGTSIAPWAKIIGDMAKVTSTSGTKAYAFQAFAGAVIPQIIFKIDGTVLAGYKLADGTGSADADFNFVDKYVTINGFKDKSAAQLTALLPHTIYQVAIDQALEISEGDITEVPNQTEVGLEVTISVKAWSKETLTPEIQ